MLGRGWILPQGHLFNTVDGDRHAKITAMAMVGLRSRYTF